MSDYPGKLYACWHPVAYAHEVTERPYPSKLLNQHLVIWRTSNGKPHAMEDLCIHRGTALSLGKVVDDCIECPYHGWRYNSEGKCLLIPQQTKSNIPDKAKTQSYLCQERYGLVWVALKEPVYALPEVPEIESSDKWKVVFTGPFSWNTDASRQVENFTDFGHFPCVHPGLLGDINRPSIPDHTVTREGHILHYTITRPEAVTSEKFPIFANQKVVEPERHSRYELHLPYTIVLRLDWGKDKGMVYFFVSQPESQKTCRGYCIIGRNYDFEQPASTLQEFESVIFGQDKRIVESQRPQQVPFDLKDELHLNFDAVAINYRLGMKALGLDYSNEI